ncbi:hypothetical protein CPC08DRAFT_96761 [Agrocybe pediades]|nr:hypothetical protein CPC08DRAFT_96761 [Agrocybe pediades]
MTARYSRHSLHLPAHGNIISSPTSPPPSIPLPLPPKSQAKSFTSSTATSTTFRSVAPKVVDLSEAYRHDTDMDTVQMHLSAIDASSDHVDLDSVLGLTADEEEAAGGGSYYHTPRSRASYLAMHDEDEDGASEGVYHPTDTFVYGYAGNVMESGRDRNGEGEEEEEEAYFRSFSASPASRRRRSATSVYATLRTRESFSARSPSSVYVGQQQQQLMVASRATISVARQVIVPSRMDREREGGKETEAETGKDSERSKRQGGEWTLGLGLEMGGGNATRVNTSTKPLVLTSSSESDLSTRESSTFSSVYSSSQAEVDSPPVVVPSPGVAAQTNSKSMKTNATMKTPIIPDQPRAGRGTNTHLLSVPTPSSCSQFVSTSLFPTISARERTQSDPSSRASSTMNVNEDWTLSMGVPSKERLLRATKSNLMGLNKGRKSDPTPAAASLLAAGPLVINVKDVDSGVEERLQVGLVEEERERESKSDMEEFHEDEVKFYVPRVVQNGRGVEDALAALTGMKRRKDVGIIRRNSGLAFLEELTVLHERQDEGDEDQQEEEQSDKSLDNAKANLATLDALSEDLRKFNELLKAAAGAGASAMVKPNLLSLEKSSSMQKLRTKKSTSVLQIDEPPPPNAVLRSMPSADTLFVDAVGAGVVMGVEEVGELAEESSSAKGPVSIPLTEFTRGPGRPRMTSRASSSALSIGSSTSGSTGNSRAPLPFAPPVSLGSTASPASVSNPTPSNSNIQTEGRAPGRALSLREATALGPVSAFEHVNGPPVSLLRRAASIASTSPSTRAAAAKARLRISIGDTLQKTTSSASRSRMSTLNSQPQQTHTLTSPSSSSLDSFASCESAASGSSSTSSTPTVTPTRMVFAVSSTSLSSSESAPTYPPVVSPVPFTSIQSVSDSSMPYPNVRTRKTALSITRASLPALPVLQAPVLSNPNEKHFSIIHTPNPPSPVSISPTTPYTPSDTLSPLTPAASAFPLPPPLPLPLLPFQQMRASALAGAQVQLLASSEPLQHTEEDIVDDTNYDAGVNAGVVEDDDRCDESGEESMESMEYYSARSSFSL